MFSQGLSTVAFTYDDAGRRTSLTLPNGVVVEYTYDNASRLTELKYKNGAVDLGNLTYFYDKAGNRTRVGGSFARTGLPQAVASATYDNANRQTVFGGKTMAFDTNGNLTSITEAAVTTLHTWNARNQLTAMSGPGVSATFVYDGLGRREKKTINGSLTEFLYDGINPTQETSGATALANTLGGLGIDEYFSRTDVPAGTTSYFLSDALGSMLALADFAGAIQTEFTYDPFGKTNVGGATDTNPFQYTGRENDGTGLYYNRSRHYHPELQRFISEDPMGFAGGDTNVYAYVGNAPTAFSDPMGLWRPWYHEDLTRGQAQGCGLSDAAANLMAIANSNQDYLHPRSWFSDTDPVHAMPGTDYRPIIDRAVRDAVAEPDWGRALAILGAGLHTVQDQWAHARRNPSGTIEEHRHPTGGRHPDEPSQNPYEWMRAREDTHDYIRDFMKGRGIKPRC